MPDLRIREESSATREVVALLGLILMLVLGACSGSGASVTGEVGKLDRMAIPEDSIVTVELRDVSLADAPAKTISTDEIEMNGDQLPAAYELPYEESEIDERNTYTVFVRVESGGSLIYITDTAYPVITHGSPTSDVEVLVVPTG